MTGVRPDGSCTFATSDGGLHHLRLVNAQIGPAWVTALYRWHFGANPPSGEWRNQPEALCPACHEWFPVAETTVDTLRRLGRSMELQDGRPCADSPNGAREKRRLLSACPSCDQSLRYSPFLRDDRHRYRAGNDGATPLGSCQGAPHVRFLPAAGPLMSLRLGGQRLATHIASSVGDPCLAWASSRKPRTECTICGKDKSPPLAPTPDGPVCRVCAEAVIQQVADCSDPINWNPQIVLEAVSSQESVTARLAVLFRLKDILNHTRTWPAEALHQLLRSIVLNLGYVSRSTLHNGSGSSHYVTALTSTKSSCRC